MTAESGLKWVLRLIGVTTIPAFIAAVTPQSWLAYMVNKAEPETSTGILVTYYAMISAVVKENRMLGVLETDDYQAKELANGRLRICGCVPRAVVCIS